VDTAPPDSQSLWSSEYNVLRGIRLHFRDGELPPSVAALYGHCDPAASDDSTLRVLDIGCGKGRIGMHLARRGFEVVAFDFVESAVAEFRTLAREYGLEQRVVAFQQDLRAPWQVDDASVDAALSVTVFSNLIDDRQLAHVKAEMLRVMRPEAVLVVEVFGPEDGYYGPLMKDAEGLGHGLLKDPNNGLTLRLFTPDALTTWLAPEFARLEHSANRSQSLKYGGTYERLTHLCVFRKGPPAGSNRP
jgi:SAM-dependent methyltransferase